MSSCFNDESPNDLVKRLKKESNKFVKACDQIKLVKKRITELLNLFNEQNTNGGGGNSSSESSSNESSNQLICLRKNSHVLREKLRLEIESLQSIKSSFFLFANRKADEITKLQCELYGEEAVRMAYDTAPSQSSSSSSSSLEATTTASTSLTTNQNVQHDNDDENVEDYDDEESRIDSGSIQNSSMSIFLETGQEIFLNNLTTNNEDLLAA